MGYTCPMNNDHLKARQNKLAARGFLIGAGMGILLGIIIGFVIGVHVAETTIVIPLGDGIDV